MKATFFHRFPALRGLLWVSGCILAALAAASSAHAQSKTVIYSPFSQDAVGNVPFTRTRVFSVKAPSNLAGPVSNIGFAITATAVPYGTAAEAVARISISPGTLSFAGPGDVQSFTVTYTSGAIDAPPGTSLNYAYQFNTTNWGVPVSDPGCSLNAKVTIPPADGSVPPVVSILTPTSGTRFTYPAGGMPSAIPMTFRATTTAPEAIVTADATLSKDGGPAVAIAPSTTNSYTIGGLGTVQADGSAQMPLTGPGVYTIVAHGSNSTGTATAISTFTVAVEGPPPAVAIDTPAPNATFDLAYGGTLNLPFSFTGTAPQSTTIRSLEARLFLNDGATATEIVFSSSGMNTVSATGSTNLPITQAGTHRLWVRATNEYGEATASQTFTVRAVKAPLTVRADNKTKLYGAALPALTYTVSGFAKNETLATSDVTGAAALFTTATAASPVAPTPADPAAYAITAAAGTLASNNYYFVFVPGTLAVTKAPLLVAAQPAAKVYGAPVPALTYQIGGYVLGENESVVGGAPVLSTAVTAGTLPGVYAIATAVGNLIATNYYFVTADSTLTVNKAELVLTALDRSRLYGDANPVLAYTATGFVNGDVDGPGSYNGATITLATTATATSSVAGSPYPITFNSVTSDKYNLTFKSAALTVKPRPLTLRADDKTRAQGLLNPLFTYTATGFVNGDTSAIFSKPPTLGTTATQFSAAGQYPITIGPGSPAMVAPNYALSFEPGTLTVTPVDSVTVSGIVFLDLNADGKRIVAGQLVPDPGLGQVTVTLSYGLGLSETRTTATDGSYSFVVPPGTAYTLKATAASGLRPTTATTLSGTAGTSAALADIGFAFNFAALRGVKADGLSQGYWKSNLTKARTRENGTQETLADLQAYTATIATLMIEPFANLTIPDALATFNGLDTQLDLQLLAAEYNFVSGRLLRGTTTADSVALTYAFVFWGEYVLQNAAGYSDAYQTFVKDWMDAFNNSHGGALNGPLP